MKLTVVFRDSVDAEDEGGWTPLIIASSAGHELVVRMLIEAGAGVNKTTREGRSALLYAASESFHLLSLMLDVQRRQGKREDRVLPAELWS